MWTMGLRRREGVGGLNSPRNALRQMYVRFRLGFTIGATVTLVLTPLPDSSRLGDKVDFRKHSGKDTRVHPFLA